MFFTCPDSVFLFEVHVAAVKSICCLQDELLKDRITRIRIYLDAPCIYLKNLDFVSGTRLLKT